MSYEKIILKGLPKISLNKWYAGVHWTERTKIKNYYKIVVKQQYKKVFKKTKYYKVSYIFGFKSRPLDASNCSAMLKLIEYIIFEDDKYNIIEITGIKSIKSKDDFVEINIKSQTL